jgi:hypothetical protein
VHSHDVLSDEILMMDQVKKVFPSLPVCLFDGRVVCEAAKEELLRGRSMHCRSHEVCVFSKNISLHACLRPLIIESDFRDGEMLEFLAQLQRRWEPNLTHFN